MMGNAQPVRRRGTAGAFVVLAVCVVIARSSFADAQGPTAPVTGLSPLPGLPTPTSAFWHVPMSDTAAPVASPAVDQAQAPLPPPRAVTPPGAAPLPGPALDGGDLRSGLPGAPADTTDPNPPVLGRPLESPPEPAGPPSEPLLPPLFTPVHPPLGFAGPSGIRPRDIPMTNHFVPVEDRWRIGFPDWDRYGNGHPPLDEYPYTTGSPLDPFNLNVLKGDYPVIGQHTFLNVTGVTEAIVEYHTVPTPTTPFESTARPFTQEFFGRPDQLFYQQYFLVTFDLFHGDAAFKPVDWRVQLTPAFNVNYLATSELAVVNPNVLYGPTRGRTWLTLQEYFLESKLADLSPDYDFISVRVGSQPFVSDFRGFIFADTNRAVRLFGNFESNRDQFNIVYFRQAEKDTNSELNTMDDRGQDIVVVNFYRQDCVFPGYTTQFSFLYNHDPSSLHFDKNSFLVRPDPAGVAQPHELNVFYLGWTGDGHIDRYNIDHAFYWALGHDSMNPIAGEPQDISAQMAAVELSYDRDWVRFRASFFWASGDKDVNNRHATGFDSIMDDPQFAGGEFSFWQRQAIRLFGVNLTNRGSLLADLRSSKIEGQSNFVNPGVKLANAGIDFELTPKLRMINNMNFLWFDETEPLEIFTFASGIHHFIGVDLSSGFEYRPLLSNNVIMRMGLSGLLPGRGFRDLYDHFLNDASPLFAAFADVTLAF
jgi:hypothetical protein